MSRLESFPSLAVPVAPAALADALGAIRAQMAALRACEAELVRAITEAGPPGPVAGSRFTATLHHSRQRSIDPARLPSYIRDDPAFWQEIIRTTVVTTPAAQAAGPEDDDFEVIERFA